MTMPKNPVLLVVMVAVTVATASCSALRGGDTPTAAAPRPSAESSVLPGSRGISFTDVTSESAAETFPQRTWGAAWVDHDGNGFPDLFVVRHWADPQFLLNDSGTYIKEEFPALVGRGFDRHGCAWGEANGDGAPDLYCVQGADMGTGAGPNALLLQRDGGLVDVATDAGVVDRLGRGRSLNWLDYDGDADLDIFVGNFIRPKAPNVLFRNDGGTFTRVEAGVSDSLASISSSWSDWDRDGDPDLLVLQYEAGGPVAYENVGGRFQRTKIRGVTGRRWWSGAWGHADSDRWMDLHLVSPGRSLILRNVRGRFRPLHQMDLKQGRMSAWFDADNDGDMDAFVVQGASGKDHRPTKRSRDALDVLLINEQGSFKPKRLPRLRGTRLGNGDAVTVADSDRDGFVDVFVTHGHLYWRGISKLLRNVSRGGTWAALDLQGPDENPLGIGAEVMVDAGKLSYTRFQTDGFNFRSQSEIGYVPLGLGKATRARVEVVWPDGGRDCIKVEAGEIEPLRIGSSPC